MRATVFATRRLLRSDQRGQALVIFAASAFVIFAVLGLVLDGSNLQLNRRKLQNAADAAAYAGAYRLPVNPNQATIDSVQWLTKNGSNITEVVTNAVSTSPNGIPNDTITVSLLRNVSYSVMKVMGLTSGNVVATAQVQVQAATGMWLSNPDFMTYAVWKWNIVPGQQMDTVTHKIGETVDFSSNKWITDNIEQPNSNPQWQVVGADFKGFMSPPGSGALSVNIGNPLLQGGQQCGQQPVAALQAVYNNPDSNGQSIIVLPIVNLAVQGPGGITFTVEGFVAVNIRVDPNIPLGCPQDFYGTIVGFTGADAIYGGQQPTPDLGCASGIGVCTARLVQ
jgi:Flp pilus assembly protein TadG